jgi:tetratricopeptide (TPR) repeat protein
MIQKQKSLLDKARLITQKMRGVTANNWLLVNANGLDCRKQDELGFQNHLINLILESSLIDQLQSDQIKIIIKIFSCQNDTLLEQRDFLSILVKSNIMISLCSTCPEGLVWQGTAFMRLKNQEEAIETFNKVLNLYPDSSYVLSMVAYNYFYYSTTPAVKDMALPLVNHLLKLDPENVYGLRLMTQHLMDEGHCDQALSYAEKNVYLHIKNSVTWQMLGNVYWCLGDRKLARDCYQKAIYISPSLEEYLKPLLKDTP